MQTIHYFQYNFYPVALVVCSIFALILWRGRFTYKVYCVLLLISVVFTCLSVPLFHKHFYDWGVQYFEHRKNIYLTNLVLNKYIDHPDKQATDKLIQGVLDFDDTILLAEGDFYDGDRVRWLKYSFSHELVVLKDDELVYSYKSNKEDSGSIVSTVSLQKKNYTITMDFRQSERNWVQTLKGYTKALARGEVVYSKYGLIKYTDFFLLNIAIFAVLIAVYTHLRYKDGVVVARRFDQLIYEKYSNEK